MPLDRLEAGKAPCPLATAHSQGRGRQSLRCIGHHCARRVESAERRRARDRSWPVRCPETFLAAEARPIQTRGHQETSATATDMPSRRRPCSALAPAGTGNGFERRSSLESRSCLRAQARPRPAGVGGGATKVVGDRLEPSEVGAGIPNTSRTRLSIARGSFSSRMAFMSVSSE